MRKRLWRSFIALSRLGVLTLVALSMAASFAFPSVTIRVPAKTKVEPITVSEHNQLLPATPEADESTGKMGTGRKQQAAPIIVAVLSSSQKIDDNCYRRTVIANEPSRFDHLEILSPDIQLTTSVSQVSAGMARQFTLVGAKPSGTM